MYIFCMSVLLYFNICGMKLMKSYYMYIYMCILLMLTSINLCLQYSITFFLTFELENRKFSKTFYFKLVLCSAA